MVDKVSAVKSKNIHMHIYDTLKDKRLILTAIFVMFLCFGFTFSNFSVGIDDPEREYYFYSNNYGNMIQQGRLTHIILNILTDAIDFLPFFSEFLGASLFTFSSLLFCALFQYISGGQLSKLSLCAFCCIYISYPITAEKFMYQLDVISVMLAYCCCAVALLSASICIYEHSLNALFPAVTTMILAIGSYESFLFLYISGVFAIFILQITICRQNKTLSTILLDGIKFAGILCLSTAIYYGLVFFLQWSTGQLGIFTRDRISGYLELGLLEAFKDITLAIYWDIETYLLWDNFSVKIFFLVTIVGGLLFFYLTLKNRNIWLMPLFAALVCSNIFIFYLLASFMPRAAQTFCFYVAFIVMILLQESLTYTRWKSIMVTVVVLLTIRQSAAINRIFYHDYKRYQQEVYTIHSIAQELIANCDITKPVVFTNAPQNGYLQAGQNPAISSEAYNSVLYWAIDAFGTKTQPSITNIFHMHGYHFFVPPTAPEYDFAYSKSQSMPAWPHKDSIQEFDQVIVVNMG